MKITKFMIVAAALVAASTPAIAAETITVPFTQPDGGVTTGLYQGTVKVRVSGTGFSLGNIINDAFYLLPGFNHDGSFYQLTFGTSTLVGLTPAQNAVNFIPGGLPAPQANSIYNFLLATGTNTPTQLHFGVGDGVFSDNGGEFTVTISAVPEPAAWAMMITGFMLVGGALRVQRRVGIRAAN